jgi:glycerophosphoryl diester phosphodiesterase
MNDFDIVDNQKLMMDSSWLGLIIPAAYIMISLFFLCFPNILHKKAKYRYDMFNDLVDSDKLLCIGHRGGSYEGPENTIEVFKTNCSRSHMF